MTQHEQELQADANPRTPYWEIDALLDGENVDREALRAALDSAEARDYFMDALMVRRWARDAGPTRFVVPARPRGWLSVTVRAAAAVVVLAAGIAGGYRYGQQSHPLAVIPEALAPNFGDDESGVPPAAPEPTQVIRFEPGVNWTPTGRSR